MTAMLKRVVVGLALFVIAIAIVDVVLFAHGARVTPNRIIADAASRLDAAFVQATTAHTPTDVFRAVIMTFVAIAVPALWLLYVVIVLFFAVEMLARFVGMCFRKITR